VIALLAVTFWQLADLLTYSDAMRLGIGREAWVAADVDPGRVVAGKAVIVAIVAGVWLFRRGRATRGYAVLVAWTIAWGVVGTAANVVNGGLLG
jgi:hypothetical protein